VETPQRVPLDPKPPKGKVIREIKVHTIPKKPEVMVNMTDL